MKLIAGIVLVSLIPAAVLDDDSLPGNPAADIINRYLTAFEAQQPQMRGVQMEVDIDASLPRLKKTGSLNALRHISRIGQISYIMRTFVGDNTVKKDVIARYLAAENQAQQGTNSIAINPVNYKFKYKGLTAREGRDVHVFQLTPHKKRVGLFKGELWLDPVTCLPVRESGRLVKNPSVFLKKVEFVRSYEIRDGVAIPRRIDSVIDTRLVGRAELHISYRSFERQETDQALVVAPAEPLPR